MILEFRLCALAPFFCAPVLLVLSLVLRLMAKGA